MIRWVATLAALLAVEAASAQQGLKLNDADAWVPTGASDPDTPGWDLAQAQQALARGEAARAYELADVWLEEYPGDALRPAALLLKGDALLALGDEYEALFEYEIICRNYPWSDVFVTALQREFQVATAYAGGLRKKFLGMFRILSGDEEAQELFIRVQERLPGSELAEQAGMALADFYYERRDFQLASDAYDLFVENYPRSPRVGKARLRLIYSYCATFMGPDHDDSGLVAAQVHVLQLKETEPAVAQQIGADALLVRIEESEAGKLLAEADWYASIGDAVGAERFIRRLVKDFPRSVATLHALRKMPGIWARLPESTRAAAPDYPKLRMDLLGLPWDAQSAEGGQ